VDWLSAVTARMKQEVNSRFYQVLVDLCKFYVTDRCSIIREEA
jgi:hypothetical protein